MKVRRKDPYLDEMIELVDTYYENIDPNLPPSIRVARAMESMPDLARDFVGQETERCADVRYYLENYHVINSESEGYITLYPFWDSQEIFFEIIYLPLMNGERIKIVVLKARQQGLCLAPNTKVLTADLKWVDIDQVSVGQEVVSTDEGLTLEEWRRQKADYQLFRMRKRRGEFACRKKKSKRPERKMRTAVVLARREVFEKAYRVTLEDGRVLVATGPHRFLCKQRGGVEPVWRPTELMCVGDEIRYVTSPWIEGSWDDAWYGGIIDGEGSLAQNGTGAEVSVSQVFTNGVYERARNYLRLQGYSFREEVDNRKGSEKSKFGKQPVGRLCVGRMDEVFRLIGKTRPTRFMGKRWWEGKSLPGKNSGIGWSRIVSIEALPEQRMIDLQTTTKTFIAEGFVSHNSTISEGCIFWKTIRNEGHNTLVIAQEPGQADYLFEMSRLAYSFLPWWMRPESQYDAKGHYLVFNRRNKEEGYVNPGLRSQLLVDAANKVSGLAAVGKTLRAAHMSEFSLWPNPRLLTRGLLPTMNADDLTAIIESTACGRRNHMFRFWKDVLNKKIEGWSPVFIESYRVKKYHIAISKDEKFELTKDEEDRRKKALEESKVEVSLEHFKWRREKIAEYIAMEGDDAIFYEQYPMNWLEAFQASGLCAFNKKKLVTMMSKCRQPDYYGEIELGQDDKAPMPHLTRVTKELHRPADIPLQEHYGGRLRIWELPREGESYYIGADVAQGVKGGDFSAAYVMKIGRGPEPDEYVAEYHGWINPTPYARVLAALGYWYGNAEIAVECNDIGLKTSLELLKSLEYPNLFRWKHYDKIKNFLSDFMGWYTNSKTRDLLISSMRETTDDDTVLICSEDLIEEMQDFGAEEIGARFEGQEGNDDRVSAAMITKFCAHDSDYGKQAASRPRPISVDKTTIMSDYQNTDFSVSEDRHRLQKSAESAYFGGTTATNEASLAFVRAMPVQGRDEESGIYTGLNQEIVENDDSTWRNL